MNAYSSNKTNSENDPFLSCFLQSFDLLSFDGFVQHGISLSYILCPVHSSANEQILLRLREWLDSRKGAGTQVRCVSRISGGGLELRRPGK